MKEIEAGRFDELETKFRDVQFERFARDLALEIDGKPAAGKWRPVETPINGKGTEGFFVYMLEFAFTAPPSSATASRCGSRTRRCPRRRW